jgi:gluconate 2-dehydrogenase gamma chain
MGEMLVGDDVAPDGLTRRTVLKRGGLLAIAIAIPAAGTGHVRPAFAAATATAAQTPGSPLSAAQSAVLDALAERLIPADATGPGAVEAGASGYIARSLGTGGLAGGLSNLAGLYTSGLTAVDAYATATYGAGFAALPPAQQDAVLTAMAAGTAPGFTPDSTTFLSTVREHTLQGMFCDPVYGGNKDFAGWTLIGYPGVRMPVPAADQKIGATVKAAHKSTYAGGQFPAAKKEAVA